MMLLSFLYLIIKMYYSHFLSPISPYNINLNTQGADAQYNLSSR